MTEAEIRRIVEEVIGELYDNGQIGRLQRTETFIDEEVRECTDFSDMYPGLLMVGTPFTDSVTQYPDKAVFVIDGVRHECEKRIVSIDGQESPCYGNAALLLYGNEMANAGDYDTGEPFVFIPYTKGFLGYIVDTTLTLEHTIAFYEVEEEIITMSEEYLPGVCLPVVDITDSYDAMFKGMYSTEGVNVSLSASESAMIAQAKSQNLPFVLRLKPGSAALIECFCYWSGSAYVGEFIYATEGTRVLCLFFEDTTTGGWNASFSILESLAASE